MAAPNPGSEFIEINVVKETTNLKSVSIEKEILITVYDNTGSVVHSTPAKGLPYRVDTSDLPAGSYFIKILDDKISETIHILVDH